MFIFNKYLSTCLNNLSVYQSAHTCLNKFISCKNVENVTVLTLIFQWFFMYMGGTFTFQNRSANAQDAPSVPFTYRLKNPNKIVLK